MIETHETDDNTITVRIVAFIILDQLEDDNLFSMTVKKANGLCSPVLQVGPSPCVPPESSLTVQCIVLPLESTFLRQIVKVTLALQSQSRVRC